MVRRRLSLPFTDVKEDDKVVADEEINNWKWKSYHEIDVKQECIIMPRGGCTSIHLSLSQSGNVLQHLMETNALLIALTAFWMIWGIWLI